eukprot:2411082-Rhodomonas_salina.1
MGAIDDLDQLLSFISVKLRGMKWWHAIFYFMINVVMVNELHLWRLANPDAAEKMEHRVWMAGLVEEIIATYGDRNGNKT